MGVDRKVDPFLFWEGTAGGYRAAAQRGDGYFTVTIAE